MTSLKKAIKKIHLWLGLASGIVVFIVCVTGCLWVFNKEINSAFLPDMSVQNSGHLLPPSRLKTIAEAYCPGAEAMNVQYNKGEAAQLTLTKEKERTQLFVNPYTGAVIYKKGIPLTFFVLF